nr:hypothetical protein BaRGS_014516 [Batillaria attramentaria]
MVSQSRRAGSRTNAADIPPVALQGLQGNDWGGPGLGGGLATSDGELSAALNMDRGDAGIPGRYSLE